MSTLQESITNLTACKYNLKNFIIYEPKTDKTAKRKKKCNYSQKLQHAYINN